MIGKLLILLLHLFYPDILGIHHFMLSKTTYLLNIRLWPGFPHIRWQLSTPWVKYLYAMSPMFYLVNNIFWYCLCQMRKESLQHMWCCVAHSLNRRICSCCTPFHNICCNCPRSPYKTQDSSTAFNLYKINNPKKWLQNYLPSNTSRYRIFSFSLKAWNCDKSYLFA